MNRSRSSPEGVSLPIDQTTTAARLAALERWNKTEQKPRSVDPFPPWLREVCEHATRDGIAPAQAIADRLGVGPRDLRTMLGGRRSG